jgi:1-acyl-sn-glycerol-3-phosphate acyltransferase
VIVYRLLRAIGRLAIRWFYRDVEVVGLERMPNAGPVLLASNHPNAMVDALVIGCTLHRPVTLTAKATLLDNPLTRALVRAVGIVPLRRASDERAKLEADTAKGATPDPGRNERAFAAVLDVLQQGGVVLLFPEGKSHSEPALAPLKTGLARIALMARDARGITPLPIVPVGLTFEQKWEPRSRVVMYVGTPTVAGADVPNDASGVSRLTACIDRRLREVTLNFDTDDEARRVLSMAGVLADVLEDFRPLHAPDPPYARNVRLAQRLDAIAARLPRVDRQLADRVDRFATRLTAFDAEVRTYASSANDVQMSTAVAPGLWFVVRELLIAVVTGPLALWGRVNHWVPLRLARSVASRTSRTPDEPAMRTIVAGLVLVLAFYAIQTTVVASIAGWPVGLLYTLSLPLSASWDFRYADRRRRAIARVRTYLRLRRDPALRGRLADEVAWLRAEALALNELLDRDSDAAAETHTLVV